jgi:hypothetical protein
MLRIGFWFWIALFWTGSTNLLIYIPFAGGPEQGAYASSNLLMVSAASVSSYQRNLQEARKRADDVLASQKLAVDQASAQLQKGVLAAASTVEKSSEQINRSFGVLNQARDVMIDAKKKAEAAALQEVQHQSKLAALTAATNAEQERLADITKTKESQVARFMSAKSNYDSAVQNLAVNRQSEIAAKKQFEEAKKNLAQLSELDHSIAAARKEIGSQVEEQLKDVRARASIMSRPQPPPIPLPVAPVLAPPAPPAPLITPQTAPPLITSQVPPFMATSPQIPGSSSGPTDCGCRSSTVPSHVYGPGGNAVPGSIPNTADQIAGYPCGKGTPLPPTPGSGMPCGSSGFGSGSGSPGAIATGMPSDGPNPYCPGYAGMHSTYGPNGQPYPPSGGCGGSHHHSHRVHAPEFDVLGRVLHGPGGCNSASDLMNQVIQSKHHSHSGQFRSH